MARRMKVRFKLLPNDEFQVGSLGVMGATSSLLTRFRDHEATEPHNHEIWEKSMDTRNRSNIRVGIEKIQF